MTYSTHDRLDTPLGRADAHTDTKDEMTGYGFRMASTRKSTAGTTYRAPDFFGQRFEIWRR